MTTESRRRVLRSTARHALAAALGALAARLLWRRGAKTAGYCDRAGRCGGCRVQRDCDVHRALHVRSAR